VPCRRSRTRMNRVLRSEADPEQNCRERLSYFAGMLVTLAIFFYSLVRLHGPNSPRTSASSLRCNLLLFLFSVGHERENLTRQASLHLLVRHCRVPMRASAFPVRSCVARTRHHERRTLRRRWRHCHGHVALQRISCGCAFGATQGRRFSA